MAEVMTPRLMQAAKEFNIGTQTLTDFLESKGFETDELKPTSKITGDMYQALQIEFQPDKVAKQKAEQIDLPKNVPADNKRRRDEQDLSFTKKETVKPKEEEVVVPEEVKPEEVEAEKPVSEPEPVKPEEVAAPEPEPKPVPVEEPPVEEKPVVEEKKEEKEVPQEVVAEKKEKEPVAETPKEKKATKKEEEKAKPEIKEEDPTDISEITKIDAPEVGGLKVVDKIDLSTIDSSVRPKKDAKKDTKKKVEKPKKIKGVKPKAPEKPVEEKPAAVKGPVAIPVKEAPAIISNIKAAKLQGPKIMGKIDLPATSDTRPKPSEERRKRKRIVVDKRPAHGGGG